MFIKCLFVLHAYLLSHSCAQHFSSKDDIVDVEVDGSYYWELLFDIDNSNNSGTLRREMQVVTDISMSYEGVVRSLESSSSAFHKGLNLGGTLFEILNIGVKGELNHEVKTEYENLSKSNTNYQKKETKTDTFEIGPNSSLKMYRLVFKGPGLSYVTDTLSTSTNSSLSAQIIIKIEQRYVLKDIIVVHTTDSVSRPDDLIKEARGWNPDINGGYGGAYTWLRAVWTKDVSEGATGIQIVIQKEENNNYVDMAKGAKGKYRYVKILRDPNSKHRITEVSLWRNPPGKTDTAELPTSSRYQFATGDINRERKGEYLYLCWNGLTISK